MENILLDANKRKNTDDNYEGASKRPHVNDKDEELFFPFNTDVENNELSDEYDDNIDDVSSSESEIDNDNFEDDRSTDNDDNFEDDRSTDNADNVDCLTKCDIGKHDINEELDFQDDNELVFTEGQIYDVDNVRTSQPPKQLNNNKKSHSSKRFKTGGKPKKRKKRKDPNMRKNIRNVFAGKEWDTMTQQLREQEQERLKRLGLPAPPQAALVQSRSKTSTSTADYSERPKSVVKEVICLDSSSDDEIPVKTPVTAHEVLVLSSDSSDEGEDEDDSIANHHSELGLHTNDAFNKPDEDGRVLINIQRKDNEECLYLSKHLSTLLKPHQIGGVRFLYDNLIESISGFHPNVGNGCILAHSMGLGKTIQTITFVDFFLRNTPAKKVLCVVPVNTIQNWVNEFNRWVPPPPLLQPTSFINQNFENVSATATNLSNVDDIISIKELLQDMVEFIDLRLEENPEQKTHWEKEIATSPLELNKANFCPPVYKDSAEGLRVSTTEEKDGNKESFAPTETMEESDYRTYEVYLIDTQKGWPDRIQTIDEWNSNGGVLLIGYEMYRLVSNGLKTKRFRGKKGKLLLEENRDIGKAMMQAVCDPGPDLVVCDEGHRIRNYQSGISQSLKSIVTKKRLVLTGYPIQNNLIEYWCMVDFVRPNYLGSRQEFANMFERPILNGQCVDSTQADKRLMRQRAHVLYSLLQGFVQRRDHSVFTSILPKKEEHVIMVRLSPLQKILYQRLIELTKEAYNDSLNPIKTFHLCCKIWNHPDILYKALQACQQGKDVDIFNDEDDILLDSESNTKQKRKKTQTIPKTEQQPSCGLNFNPTSIEPKEFLMDITQWAPSIFKNFPFTPGDLNNSGKFDLLNKLIHESVQADDKMLIFSQSLLTLNAIEEMLQKSCIPQEDYQCWKKGEDYFRLDGGTTSVERERFIKLFNDKNNKTIKLFLLSTRAGCLGINLVSANRVVVFDVSWNPCHDAQAVCRIYRYGQTKPCHIYRFVASNTMEKKMYYRQISKQGISNRVVDEMNQTENFSKNEIQSLIIEDWVDEPSVELEAFISKQTDHVFQNVLLTSSKWIAQVPFKHESLLINDTEAEVLSGSEKRAAKRAYEVEKKMSQNRPYPLQPSFPRNTPVAPVKPFLWRPPTLANISSHISFPVMVSNHTSVSNSNGNNNNAILSEYASMLARLTSNVSTQPIVSIATTVATPSSATITEENSELSTLLNTVRHSLSATNVAPASYDALSTSSSFIPSTIVPPMTMNSSLIPPQYPSIPQLFQACESQDVTNLQTQSLFTNLSTHGNSTNDPYSDIHGTYRLLARQTFGKITSTDDIIVLDDSEEEV